MDDYRERLRVPLAWWLLAMPSALILGATLYAGLTGPWPFIIMAVLVAGCALLLITMGLGSIEVRDGTLRGYTKVARDITERKRAEERLRESERQFRLLADALPQIAWTTDPGGRVPGREIHHEGKSGRDNEHCCRM